MKFMGIPMKQSVKWDVAFTVTYMHIYRYGLDVCLVAQMMCQNCITGFGSVELINVLMIQDG